MAITGRLTADRDQTGLGARGTAGAPASGDDTPTRSDRPGDTSAGGATAAAANIRQLDAETIRTVAGNLLARDGPPLNPPEHVAPAALTPVPSARPDLR